MCLVTAHRLVTGGPQISLIQRVLSDIFSAEGTLLPAGAGGFLRAVFRTTPKLFAAGDRMPPPTQFLKAVPETSRLVILSNLYESLKLRTPSGDVCVCF